jgi:hypothetical protein
MINEEVWSIGGMTIDRGRPNYPKKILCQGHLFHYRSPKECPEMPGGLLLGIVGD